MKYLVILFLFVSSTAFGQDYKTLLAAHREDYKADFLKEKYPPLREKDFKDLHFYDADSTFRITAKVKILQNEQPFKMPTFDGSSKDFVRYAKLTFTLNGKPVEMTLYKSITLAANPEYKDYLFLPFSDPTNGNETYGGGRYIDLNLNNIRKGKIELDFNMAYNPYCAYSEGYRCPVPPADNALTFPVPVGEKKYTGEKKQL